jgi:hypothetical protein
LFLQIDFNRGLRNFSQFRRPRSNTVNSPRGEIVKGNEAVKELIRSGVINYASFLREIELVLIHGKTVIVMGRETVVPNENAPQAGQTVRRR